MYGIELLPSAGRELAKLEPAIRRRVARRIDQLGVDPSGRGSVKLRGSEDVWRARVGDYGILYSIEDARLVVVVIRIGHRGDVYR